MLNVAYMYGTNYYVITYNVISQFSETPTERQQNSPRRTDERMTQNLDRRQTIMFHHDCIPRQRVPS